VTLYWARRQKADPSYMMTKIYSVNAMTGLQKHCSKG